MIRLSEKYGDHPVEEYPLLFQRILQNAIRDFYRRSKVRTRWVSLFSSMLQNEDEDRDLLETLETHEQGAAPLTPEQCYSRDQLITIIEDELKKLPARQREAFIMRYWFDLDVTETAAAMGCGEGSIKTHCSRATHTLATALRKKGISYE